MACDATRNALPSPRDARRSLQDRGLPTEMREAQEVEGLRLALAAPFPALGRMVVELDQARFLGMQ